MVTMTGKKSLLLGIALAFHRLFVVSHLPFSNPRFKGSSPMPSGTSGLRSFSPRTGAAAASVLLPGSAVAGGVVHPVLIGQLSSSSLDFTQTSTNREVRPPLSPGVTALRRRRSHTGHQAPSSASMKTARKSLSHSTSRAREKAQARLARKINDAMVYLDGPQVYTCGQCRTHFTSHDEIVSKSFHGRHGE